MKWRLNLFTRMFLGFWLVTIAVLGSWMLSARYFEQITPITDSGPGVPPQRALLRLFYDLQQLEPEQLPQRLEEEERRQPLRIFVLNREGRELRGRELPTPVRRVMTQLQNTDQRRLVHRSAQGHLLGHRLYRTDTGPLRVVVYIPPPRPGLAGALQKYLWLRILLLVVVSGLVCYGLSRLITRRLQELQLASRQLASGQLDTRIAVRDVGGDETDELARDFNSMAAQLQERIQLQKQLLRDVSHELRSPLARLRIALALAQEDPATGSEHLARIERETARLEELIGQLLETGAQDLELQDHLDVGVLLQSLCRDAAFEGEGAGKSIAYSAPDGPAVVATRGDLLKKCFENLLRNALRHTPDNSVISVTARSRGEFIDIQVQDRGPGVPPEELKRIFDAFYRADPSRSRDAGGYGLGLSIARRAVLQHRGEIFAENTGDGLRVTVSLPLIADDTLGETEHDDA